MTRQELLDLARKALDARAENYDPPGVSFTVIAEFWSIILNFKVRPHQVALCMAALKMTRLIRRPDHDDSWVDLAGYAACGAEVADREPRGIPIAHKRHGGAT